MCSAGILTIQNVGELCAQRLQRLCIDKKETGSKAVSVRKNSTPYTKKERIVHPHLSRVMCYSYCSCIAAREFRSEWKPSSPNMAAASNGILSDAVTGGRSPGVFPSVEGRISSFISCLYCVYTTLIRITATDRKKTDVEISTSVFIHIHQSFFNSSRKPGRISKMMVQITVQLVSS